MHLVKKKGKKSCPRPSLKKNRAITHFYKKKDNVSTVRDSRIAVCRCMPCLFGFRLIPVCRDQTPLLAAPHSWNQAFKCRHDSSTSASPDAPHHPWTLDHTQDHPQAAPPKPKASKKMVFTWCSQCSHYLFSVWCLLYNPPFAVPSVRSAIPAAWGGPRTPGAVRAQRSRRVDTTWWDPKKTAQSRHWAQWFRLS